MNTLRTVEAAAASGCVGVAGKIRPSPFDSPCHLRASSRALITTRSGGRCEPIVAELRASGPPAEGDDAR